MAPNPPPRPVTPSPDPFEAAHAATAPSRAALDPQDLLPLSHEPQVAVDAVLGLLPRIRTLRPAIIHHLPTFDITQLDTLETYAQALLHAHLSYLAEAEGADALPALRVRAAELRDLLLADARSLARRKRLDGAALRTIQRRRGYLEIAAELGILVRLLRDHWSDLEGRCSIEIAELAEAETLVEAITVAHAARSKASPTTHAAADDRVRAWTVLVRAYKQVRRASLYLHFGEEDEDTFVPSLWASLAKKRRPRRKPATPATPRPT